MPIIYWAGPVPPFCEIDGEILTTCFIDGALRGGGWAIMCPACHKRLGVGFGVGLGQRFELQANNQWQKVVGKNV